MGISTHILIARRKREAEEREAQRRAEAREAPPESALEIPETLPAGYTAEHVRGGYYELRAPDGSLVEGPSNGKWQGFDGAVAGAWVHAGLPAGPAGG